MNRYTVSDVCRVGPRYEKKSGYEKEEGMPRCVMAATFRTAEDPSGEKMLRHWVAQGHIRDRFPISPLKSRYIMRKSKNR